MLRRSVSVLSVLALLLVVALPASANKGNVTAEKLADAGWVCDNIEGEDHCFSRASQIGSSPSINVMVFNTDGSFAGTEILWHNSVYAGQDCSQDPILDLNPGLPYYACHHYSHG